MSLKKVYEFLEKSEDGKAILALLKEEVEQFKDIDAKSRLAEKQLTALNKEVTELKEIKEKLDKAGIDPDELEGLKKNTEGKTELEKQISSLTKQIATISKNLEVEKAEKEKLAGESKLTKLKADIGGDLKTVFGKFGDILAENLISKGQIKFDDKGEVIYETAAGIYKKSEAVDMLKTEYKDHIVTKPSGSNFLPPARGGNGDVSAADMAKMSSSELLAMPMTRK